MQDNCINTAITKKGYKDQLIYYYNNKNKKSEISGALITDGLISVIEHRYSQIGGILPISEEDILLKKDKKWQLVS
tara:strand:- start:188 stop:415 length:228 start_codon:yes stop_codon:yes gene_type:complete